MLLDFTILSARCDWDAGDTLTVEGTRVKPLKDTLGGNEKVHSMTKPVRQDQQEQLRDIESLRLEVVNLRKNAVRCTR